MAGAEIASYLNALGRSLEAATPAAKAAALAGLVAPADGAAWPMPELPRRPGRAAALREAISPPRRRRTLAHAGTRNRFLLAFHEDFLGIARDEARHAALLEELLAGRGIAPGDEPVHFRLWESTLACRDLGEHLVVVPRVLEARGLDVAAELLPRLHELDPDAHQVLSVIYQDEIGHVAIGTRWQQWWCVSQGREPLGHFAAVLARHFPGQHPWPTPLDLYGRRQAGFSASELELLGGGIGV